MYLACARMCPEIIPTIKDRYHCTWHGENGHTKVRNIQRKNQKIVGVFPQTARAQNDEDGDTIRQNGARHDDEETCNRKTGGKMMIHAKILYYSISIHDLW